MPADYYSDWVARYAAEGIEQIEEYLARWAKMYDYGGAF